MPTLALCIPAYNAADHLPLLLASADAQTVPFDEILVYDDCSTDGTADVARSCGAMMQVPVRVVSGHDFGGNAGCSTGKNRLAEATACEWVHFHDADDALVDTFVATARTWIALGDDAPAGAPDVVLFGYEERDGETRDLLGVRRFDDDALRADPIRYSIREQINPFCGLYRRSAFLAAGGYDTDPDVLYNEDVAFHQRIARAGLTFRADPAVVVVNFRYSNSMSQGNLGRCIAAHVRVLEKAAETVGDRYGDEIARKAWYAAGVAGSYLEWGAADRAVSLARRLGRAVPPDGNAAYKAVAVVAPRLALRVRERAIRRLRPVLRQGAQYHPAVRAR